MVHQTGAEASVLAADTPCIECGYDLGGLSPGGVCPECAVPIATTVQGGLLRFSDPAYIRRLRNGAAMVVFGVLGGLVVSLGSFLIESTVADGSMAFTIVSSALWLLVAIAMTVGLWWLTTRDPNANSRKALTPSRLSVRIALCMMIALSALTIVDTIYIFNIQDDNLYDQLALANMLLNISATLSYFIVFIFSAWYVRGLSRRLPDAALRSRAGVVMLLQSIAVGLILAALLSEIALSDIAMGMAGIMLYAAAGVLFVAVVIIYLLMLERARAVLSRTLREMSPGPAPA